MKSDEVMASYAGIAGMLVSSIEVYPKESFGFLAGFRKASRNLLAVACPVQTARRKKSVVWIVDHASYKRARDAVASISDYLFGAYHSHPGILEEPSEEDLQSALVELDMLPLDGRPRRFLIVIAGIRRKANPRKSKRRQRRETIVRSSSDGDFIGAKAYCGRYLYEMRFYGYWVETEDLIESQYPNIRKAKFFFDPRTHPRSEILKAG